MHFDSEDGLQTVVTTVVSCPDGTLHGPLELPAAFGAGSGSESLDGRRPSASSRAAISARSRAMSDLARQTWSMNSAEGLPSSGTLQGPATGNAMRDVAGLAGVTPAELE